MRLLILLIVMPIASIAMTAFSSQSGSAHKPEGDIARMTPEQRVQEYCREYIRHNVSDTDYLRLVNDYIMRDRLKAIPPIVNTLDDFDPTDPKHNGNDRYEASSAATILVADLDLASFRLRAYKESTAAIDALQRLIDRMQAAHFETAPSEGERSRRIRYEITLRILTDVRGNNDYDRAIQDTLELRHKARLSDEDLLKFSNYLIARDPYYSRWSGTEWFFDKERESKHKRPWQYRIIQNIERFHKEYLEFKAKQAP